MIRLIDTRKTWVKAVIIITMYSFVFEVFYPLSFVFGQSGPGQMESSGLSLGSTSGMVNKFTGDFNYSIPLMDVEGYPITLNYNQNIGMNTEASWVGLGWDLSVGAVSREKRGLPDDFNGEDQIEREVSQRNIHRSGYKQGAEAAVTLPNDLPLSLSAYLLFGRYYSSLNGYGRTYDFGVGGGLNIPQDIKIGLGLGVSADSQNGVGVSPNLGISGKFGDEESAYGGSFGRGFSASHHSRSGWSSVSSSFSLGFSYNNDFLESATKGSIGFSRSLGTATVTPSFSIPTYGSSNNNEYLNTVFYFSGVVAKFSSKDVLYNSDVDFDVVNNKILSPAYGYFHSAKSSNASESEYVLMDYNQSNSVEFSEEQKNLPFSTPTYDIFRVAAQGVGGSFRAQRSDVGTFFDPSVKQQMDMKNTSFELGNGVMGTFPAALIGFSYGEVDSEQETGGWIMTNEKNFLFSGDENPNFDNSVFFKSASELTPRKMDLLDAYGGNTALHREVKINLLGGNYVFEGDELVGNMNTDLNVSNAPVSYNNSDEIRATHYRPRTAEMEVNMNNNSSIDYYTENDFSSTFSFSRLNGNERKAHHLSSMEVTNTSGAQYYFGVPVYDLKEEQITFSASGMRDSWFDSHGQVEYNHGVDDSPSNNKDKISYYEKKTIPAHSHSFLLSELRTSDYVDRTGDGPSLDDIGNYYKFNYSLVYDKNEPYTWREPVSGLQGSDPKASLNVGLEANPFDDMAHYTYGEKELWYVNSVESKNMVAHFHISGDMATDPNHRRDGFAVKEDGTLDLEKCSRKLDSIVLYNKHDLENSISPTPLQVVIFEYDYSLCKNYPKNIHTYDGTSGYDQSGKLTLKKIRIKTGDSEEQALYPYEFEYNQNNFDFSYVDIDRWGNYKNNNISQPNYKYPYVEQNLLATNNSASAWKLSKVINPLGGLTEVEYEADRYAFVQDKSAMRHFKNVGMTNLAALYSLNNSNFNNFDLNQLSNKLRAEKSDLEALDTDITDSDFFKKYKGVSNLILESNRNARRVPNNVLVFELGESYSGASKDDLEEKLKEEYFRDHSVSGLKKYYQEIYLKTRVKINPDKDEMEDIPTFARIGMSNLSVFNSIAEDEGYSAVKDYGLVGNQAPYNYAYVIVEPDNVQDMKRGDYDDPSSDPGNYQVNPIQKTAWQFARQNLPELVYANCSYDPQTEQFDCDYNLSIDWQVMFFQKVNKILNRKEFCLEFDTNHSWIRLNHNNDGNDKLASSARVKSITYSDNWNDMSGEYESTYTWLYDYKEEDLKTGVAAYEPIVGKDENPFFRWDRYWNKLRSFPDESAYTEEPVAELIFPAPVVGYESVKVRFSDTNNSKHKVGESISNFITAKQHPTKVKRTQINKKTFGIPLPVPLANLELVGLSQGYVVETNGFHGQPKSNIVKNASGIVQSETKYIYKTQGSSVNVINREGDMNQEKLGIEYDVYATSSFNKTRSKYWSVGLDSYVAFTPVPLPTFFPTFNLFVNEKGFYTNTFNKSIHYTPIVESVETNYLGSKNSAENLAYDKFTGNVILSSLKDEYEDQLFSLNYPAHWYYDNFRNKEDQNPFRSSITVNNGLITLTSDLDAFLAEGDQLLLDSGSGVFDAYVLEKKNGTASLITPAGLTFGSGTFDVTIKKSGRKNRLNEVMQSVTTKSDDLINGSFSFPTDNILSVNVKSFSENRHTLCGERNPDFFIAPIQPNTHVNPYQIGVKGNYKIVDQYAFQEGRNSNDPHKSRFDGELDNYISFYKLDVNNKWKQINETGHPNYISNTDLQSYRKLQHQTRHDEFGKLNEAKDQINVHSSVLYGYNNAAKLIPVAEAVNAKQTQIAFDGFEDYDYLIGNNASPFTHFDFSYSLGSGVTVSSKEKHSGAKSLSVGPESIGSVSKSLNIEECTDPNIVNDQYYVRPCDCVADFSPEQGEYVISLWVKEDNHPEPEDYNNHQVKVIIGGVSSYSFQSTGTIIDGWQRLEGVFDITGAATNIEVELINNHHSNVYFDDVRIHPYKASMQTTIYDEHTLLPVARHDAYNFTTFYNYDENLSLRSIRVETTEGIKTITEQESGSGKDFRTIGQ